jgi:hypothetical protein
MLCEFVTLVDDFSIQADLDETDASSKWFQVRTEDLTLALRLERLSATTHLQDHSSLTRMVEDNSRQALHGGIRAPCIEPYSVERARVTEIVTRPLSRQERTEALRLILRAARDEGFEIPKEAAFHTHFDREPWMTTNRMRRLVLDFDRHRYELHRTLGPNPHCRLVGEFRSEILAAAAATAPTSDFFQLRARLRRAGVTKAADLNIRGLVCDSTRQPTIEYRSLPMSLDFTTLAAMLEVVEGFLGHVVRDADAEVAHSISRANGGPWA